MRHRDTLRHPVFGGGANVVCATAPPAPPPKGVARVAVERNCFRTLEWVRVHSFTC